MLVHFWATVCDANIVPALGECVVFAESLCLTFQRKDSDVCGTFDNHGQINDTVNLQLIHTPDLFIYVNNDLI